jgi:hypothetical protein
MPVGYYGMRNLIGTAGVACVIFGLLNMSWLLIVIGGAILGYFAFAEK